MADLNELRHVRDEMARQLKEMEKAVAEEEAALETEEVDGLFLVSRTDRVGYDDYNGLVIQARDLDDAHALIRKLTTEGGGQGEIRLSNFRFDPPNFTIEALGSGPRGVILASYIPD